MDLGGSVEIATLILAFLGTNIWPLILFAFLIIARAPIAGLLDRLAKLSLNWGDGSMEIAAPPKQLDLPPTKTEVPSVATPIPPREEEAQVPENASTEDWFIRMHQAFFKGEVSKAREIFEAHLREEKQPDARHTDESIFLYLLFTAGKDPRGLRQLEELHARSANDRQRTTSAGWLAWGYETLKDFSAAERVLQSAMSTVSIESEKTQLVVRLAGTYRKSGAPAKAIANLENRLLEADAVEDRVLIYSEIAAIEKERGQMEAAALALEKVVELAPADTDKLFEAAYAQSDGKLRISGMAHYDTLLALDWKNSTVLNNLAVTAHELKLPGKEVLFFERAAKEGNTLAMANLANAYARAGFWKDAKKVLDEARIMDSPHENVGQAIYRLHTIQEEEEKKWKELGDRARTLQQYVRQYAAAYFDRSGAKFLFAGIWTLDTGVEVTVLETGEIKAEWQEEGGVLLMGSLKYKCSILGTRRNRSVSLSYRKERVGERFASSLLLGGGDEVTTCFSYLTRDGSTWHIFSVEAGSSLLLTLRRKQ
jgi:tetratricopeptide (TPR) repeat protein